MCLVGLRNTVVLDTSALALLPVDGDEDEDAARMFPGQEPYRELWKISMHSGYHEKVELSEPGIMASVLLMVGV